MLDTNIVIYALLWKGAPAKLLSTALESGAFLISSPVMIDELVATLGKTKLQRADNATGLSAAEWAARYSDACQLVVPAKPEPIAPDPDDDWVIATALAGRADFIVTGDKPFLTVSSVGNLRIVTTREAMRMLAIGD